MPIIHIEQNRAELPYGALTDEALQPAETPAIQRVGGRLVPLSFEVDGGVEGQPIFFECAHAIEVLFRQWGRDVNFVSLSNVRDLTQPDEVDTLEILLEEGDPSKNMPVIKMGEDDDDISIFSQAVALKQRGVQQVIVQPPALNQTPGHTAEFLGMVREAGNFERVGVVMPLFETTMTKEQDSVVEQAAESLSAADFGITRILLNSVPYARLQDAMQSKDVNRPIIPGIKPFSSLYALEKHDRKLYPTSTHVHQGGEPHFEGTTPQALNSYFSKMAVELIKEMGAPALHIYTGNSVKATERLIQGIRLLMAEEIGPSY